MDTQHIAPQNGCMSDERAAIARWRKGHRAAAARALALAMDEGPDPRQASREAIAAFEALPRQRRRRDRDGEVDRVRRMWVRIERRAQASAAD